VECTPDGKRPKKRSGGQVGYACEFLARYWLKAISWHAIIAMNSPLQALGIDRLSVEDRIALATAIWESIAAEPHQPLLTEAQRRELRRRLADHAAPMMSSPGNRSRPRPSPGSSDEPSDRFPAGCASGVRRRGGHDRSRGPMETAIDYIICKPGVCGGKPCIAGTRIRVQDIFVWHELQGQSADEIVSKFPHLTMAGVYAALAYYWDHRDEIRQQMYDETAFVERMKLNYPSLLEQKRADRLEHI
jgi:putative addiction module component (TIGR02574 family)